LTIEAGLLQARAFTTNAHAGQPHTEAILLTITGNPHASVGDHSITSLLQPIAPPTNLMLHHPCRQNCSLALAESPLAGLTSGLAYVNPLAAQLIFASLLLQPHPIRSSLLYPWHSSVSRAFCTLFCSKRTSQEHNQV